MKKMKQKGGGKKETSRLINGGIQWFFDSSEDKVVVEVNGVRTKNIEKEGPKLPIVQKILSL